MFRASDKNRAMPQREAPQDFTAIASRGFSNPVLQKSPITSATSFGTAKARSAFQKSRSAEG